MQLVPFLQTPFQVGKPKVVCGFILRFPANATSNGLALSTRLLEMMGRFSGQAVQMLPTSIQELRLAIADDHDALDWFGALPKISQTLPSLRSICEWPSLILSLQ